MPARRVGKDETLESDRTPESDPRQELLGSPLTWGETPLLTNAKQYEVYLELLKRMETNVPEGTPREVQEYIVSHFMARFYQRQLRNEQSYDDRSVEDLSQISSETLSILIWALKGVASPAELLPLRSELGMPSIELARLSHPYVYETETLDEMRAAVDYAIEKMGGEPCEENDCTTYGIDASHTVNNSGRTPINRARALMLANSVMESDKAKLDDMVRFASEYESVTRVGILIKRKRIVATLPDGTVIIERSSFVLRIDEDSDLDQAIAKKIRGVVIEGNPNWESEMMAAGNLLELVPQLLAENKFKIAIPLSTTFYAYNPERVEEVKLANEEKRKGWSK